MPREQLEALLEDHLAYTRAIDAAWRWFRRSDKPKIALSEIVERVRASYLNVDVTEIERRMKRTRSRRKE